MIEARLYGNENFDLQVVEHLRNLGFDVLTAKEAGNANQRIPDEQVMEFALREKRAVLTFNRKDFFKLHKSIPNHFGIVACTYDANYEAFAKRIQQAVLSQLPLNGKLIRVYRPIS
ncbi:MAG: DUF5615 family PIN-like protein [Bacteroidota bacterium]